MQHLPDTHKHRHTPGVFGDHDVRLDPGSLAARATGAETSPVKSHHHQGVATLGDGAVASGWDEDGTIEAIELPERALRARRAVAPGAGRAEPRRGGFWWPRRGSG